MNKVTSGEVSKQESSCEVEMVRARRAMNLTMGVADYQKRPRNQKGVAFNTVMLRETDMTIRQAVFDLSKMNGVACMMDELKAGEWHTFDLMKGIPELYKVNVCYKPTPLKIEIKYSLMGMGMNFYGSFSSKEPHAAKNEFKKEGKHFSMFVYPRNDPKN
jgi:hypothetical protein